MLVWIGFLLPAACILTALRDFLEYSDWDFRGLDCWNDYTHILKLFTIHCCITNCSRLLNTSIYVDCVPTNRIITVGIKIYYTHSTSPRSKFLCSPLITLLYEFDDVHLRLIPSVTLYYNTRVRYAHMTSGHPSHRTREIIGCYYVNFINHIYIFRVSCSRLLLL